MLEPHEIRLIRKYALAPTLAVGGLAGAVVSLASCVALCAFDGVFYHSRDVFVIGLAVGMVLAVGLGIGGLYMYALNRRRDYNPAWLELCDHTLRAGPFARDAGPSLCPEVVAHYHDVPLIPTRAVIAGAILLPPALLLSLFLPHYRAESKRLSAERDVVVAAMESLQQTMEDNGCSSRDLSYDDPREYYSSYGYTFDADLDGKAAYDNPGAVSVSVGLDTQGKVCELSYTVGVDVNKTPQENLDMAQQKLAQANAILRQITVESVNEDIFTDQLLPEEFTQDFLDAAPYQNAYGWEETGDAYVSVSYYTDPEEEYDEYSASYIQIWVDEW